MIRINVYAPNDHNEEYFDHLKDIMLDIQIGHPTLPVIMLGDVNVILEEKTILQQAFCDEHVSVSALVFYDSK